MKKNKGILLVGVIALIIGLLFTIQVTTNRGTDKGGLVPLAKAQDLERELKKIRTEKEQALEELRDMENKMEKIKTKKADEDYALKGMIADVEKYKVLAGAIDVHGSGVVISVRRTDPSELSASETPINWDLNFENQALLNFVNRLKDAGAEAISINGNRIIAASEISLSGEHININSRPTAPPYIIKAIGNPKTIESAVSIRFGIVDVLSEAGYKVKISKKKDLDIQRYSGVLKYRYAKPVSE